MTPNHPLRDRDFTLAWVNGVFDLFHAGHRQLLLEASKHADKLVVALNTDPSVNRLKPDRPYMPLEYRKALISDLRYVDYVLDFDDDTPERLLEAIKPDVMVIGESYSGTPIAGANHVKEIVYVPLLEGWSTTTIIMEIMVRNLSHR